MVLAGVISCLFATSLLAEQAKKAAKKEFQFRGKVEKVDLSAKTFTVTNEKVEGWMDKMSMVYVPDKEDVLKRVKAGDQITAKVYEGDFRVLHEVQVVTAKPDAKAAPGKAPAKK